MLERVRERELVMVIWESRYGNHLNKWTVEVRVRRGGRWQGWWWI